MWGPPEHVLFGLARWHSSGPIHAYLTLPLCYFDRIRAYSKATQFTYLYLAFVVCSTCKIKGGQILFGYFLLMVFVTFYCSLREAQISM